MLMVLLDFAKSVEMICSSTFEGHIALRTININFVFSKKWSKFTWLQCFVSFFGNKKLFAQWCECFLDDFEALVRKRRFRALVLQNGLVFLSILKII
jgi:hypothetical protein